MQYRGNPVEVALLVATFTKRYDADIVALNVSRLVLAMPQCTKI